MLRTAQHDADGDNLAQPSSRVRGVMSDVLMPADVDWTPPDMGIFPQHKIRLQLSLLATHAADIERVVKARSSGCKASSLLDAEAQALEADRHCVFAMTCVRWPTRHCRRTSVGSSELRLRDFQADPA